MVPIVIFTYNRFEEFQKVLFACNGLPVIVYVDGPRTSEDVIAQNLILDLARKTSYVVNVKHTSWNQGCKRHIINGVQDTLGKYGAAIFLEDDCVPVSGFYEYSLRALNYFKKYSNIGLISLSNLVDSNSSRQTRASVFINCWGWATWSNRVSLVTDIYTSSNDLNLLARSRNFSSISWLQKIYWRNIFLFAMNQSSIWDFYIQFRFFINDIYSIVPPYNLVNNIGFSDKATHTKFSKMPNYVEANYAVNLPCSTIDEIEFTDLIDSNRDQKISKNIYQYSIFRLIRLMFGNSFRLLKRVIY